MSPGRTGPAVVAAAVLVAQQVAGRAVRDALFLSSFDVTRLPPMTAGAALVSLLVALAFARAMAALSPRRLLPAALLGSAVLFLAEWGLTFAIPRVAAVLVYLHHAVLGAALLSAFWSMVTERFDPHAARRAMGAIGTGASLGGVLGGLLTWQAAALVNVPTMLVVLAGTSLLALPSVLRLQAEAGPRVRAGVPGDEGGAPSGLRLIREVPYLRRLALLVALGAFLETLLDYLLNAAAAATIAKGAPLMSFFALFHGATGLLALAVQALLVPTWLQRLGLAGTLAIQPTFAAAGAAVVLAFPRLASIVALRGGQAVLRNSAFRSSYELLYTPLPQDQKRPTKVIVDVGCDRLGTVAGSAAVILVLLAAPLASTRLLLVLAALAAGLCLVLVPRFHRGYVGALAESLRTGAVTLEPDAVVDATTRLTLQSLGAQSGRRGQWSPAADDPPIDAPFDPLMDAIAALRSGNPTRIRGALEGPELDPRLVSHVIALLPRDDVFDATASSLRRTGARSVGQLVDALLDPQQDPAIRRRIPRVLAAVPTQRSADGLLLGLADERFDLRYRCAQALSRIRGSAVVILRDRVLDAVLRDADHAAESGRHLDHVFTLLALILDREPLQIALKALRAGDETLRGTALEYLDNVLPAPVKDRLWPHLGGTRRPAPSGRSTEEIRDDLLRSTASVGGSAAE